MSDIYTKQKNYSSNYPIPEYTWKDISPSEITRNKRGQFAQNIDKFARFQWRGVDAWDVFGAFIISEKNGDLQFYNGSQYSSEYSTPKFANGGGELLGVSAKQQQIKFKMGMYWFDIDTYRKFIEWLNPKVINYLTFSFDTEYGYLVKLSTIADSPRYIVGNEGNNPMYYTELTLTWEVQGQGCVRSIEPMVIDYGKSGDVSEGERFNIIIDSSKNYYSYLDTPLILEFAITTLDLEVFDTNPIITFKTQDDEQLFRIELDKDKLVYSRTVDNVLSNPEIDIAPDIDSYILHFRYDSESGLLFQQFNDTWRLVNYLTTTTYGDNLLVSYQVQKYLIGAYKSLNAYTFFLECNFEGFIIENTATDANMILTTYRRAQLL